MGPESLLDCGPAVDCGLNAGGGGGGVGPVELYVLAASPKVTLLGVQVV